MVMFYVCTVQILPSCSYCSTWNWKKIDLQKKITKKNWYTEDNIKNMPAEKIYKLA